MIPKSRVEAFSDSVMAIVMTLIAFDLRPPAVGSHTSLAQTLHLMLPFVPLLISFALSFTMVTVYWINHYYLFHHVKTVTVPLLWLNGLLLFWICVLPFTTQFLGEHPVHPLAITAYATNLLLVGLSYLLLRRHILKAGLFDATELAGVYGPHHSVPSIVLSLCAIVLAPINSLLALGCLLLLPLLYLGPKTWKELAKHSRRLRKRHLQDSVVDPPD